MTRGTFAWKASVSDNFVNGDDYELCIGQGYDNGYESNWSSTFPLGDRQYIDSLNLSTPIHSSVAATKSSATFTTQTSPWSLSVSRSPSSPTTSSANASKTLAHDLNAGIEGGIGIAAAVVGIAVLVALSFLLRKRMRKRRWQGGTSTPQDGSLAGGEKIPEAAQEKDGVAIIGELSTKANTHELSPDAEKRPPLFELAGL